MRGLVVVAIAVGLLLAGGAIYYAVQTNQSDINANNARLAKLERRNVGLLRHAAFRICARGDLVRAEVHSAYQQKVPPADPQLSANEPILAFLLQGAERNREVSLKRVRRNLPILDCRPNLRGEAAVPLPRERQALYVERYLANQLDPTPGDAVLSPTVVSP